MSIVVYTHWKNSDLPVKDGGLIPAAPRQSIQMIAEPSPFMMVVNATDPGVLDTTFEQAKV